MSALVTEPLPQTRKEAKQLDAKSGKTSFALLVRQHHERLYWFIYRYTKNREDAEDLTQDTFVKAFRYFDRYDHSKPFAAWLLTIGRRTVYNHYRAKKELEVLDKDMVDDSERPDSAAEKEDRKASIWKAAEKLKPKYREALMLKYVEDLSVKEIAQVLNVTQTNVKILLFRARNKLKSLQELQTKE